MLFKHKLGDVSIAEFFLPFGLVSGYVGVEIGETVSYKFLISSSGSQMSDREKKTKFLELTSAVLASLNFEIFFNLVGDLLETLSGTGVNLSLVWFKLLIVASICELQTKKC